MFNRSQYKKFSTLQYAVRLAIILCLFSLPVAQAKSFDHEHAAWNRLLQTYVVDKVHSSEVRYAAWLNEGRKDLQQYLQALNAVSREQFDAWSKGRQLAFLINAYNAFTVELILRHYPVESIKDIGGFFRSPWKIEFFELFGDTHHLDYIEHDLIRGGDRYREPRIHFALVCASVGCPKLHSQAFTAERLEPMLELGARVFLQDTQRNRYDDKRKQLQLSSIFKWYREDFEQTHGSVRNYVANYMSDDASVRQQIRSGDVEVDYLNYDWSLNDVSK
jgi:hypothetical protein